jgi:hypothetical protein
MRRAPLAVASVLAVVLVVGQFVLPGVAARRLRSDLERHGSDVSVRVKAVPAVKLLWHAADDVTVRVGHYRTGGASKSSASLPELLASTKATDQLDVRVGVLEDRRLTLHDVRLRKNGDTLVGQVRMTQPDVDAALPAKLHLAGRQAAPNQLRVTGRTSVFGRRLAGGAVILVDDEGRIVLRPAGVPLASFVTVPVFSDDRVAVDAITAARAAGGFAVTARGHLR